MDTRMNSLEKRLGSDLDDLRRAGTYKDSLYLETPMAPRTRMEGHGGVIVLSSNNYLGLCDHPEVIRAGQQALAQYGAGTASVRFICGSFKIHRQLEEKIAAFLGMESALSYVSCWNANTGLLATLTRDGDVLISDELNHASIIDACRVVGKKVQRQVYRHSDMAELEEKLKECRNPGQVFIITDGVFSMEGDIARLPDIVRLAKKYNAVTIVDDSHGTGVMGRKGRGTVEHFGLEGQVDIITSTLGKALGGAAGGFVAAKKCVTDYLFQKSRPMLFSNALPPTVAASALMAITVLEEHPELVQKLRDNIAYFRRGLQHIGIQALDGESAIIPIIIGPTAAAIAMSKKLLANKIFVTGFGFPVVPEGTARIRLQMSAALTNSDMDEALAVLKKVFSS